MPFAGASFLAALKSVFFKPPAKFWISAFKFPLFGLGVAGGFGVEDKTGAPGPGGGGGGGGPPPDGGGGGGGGGMPPDGGGGGPLLIGRFSCFGVLGFLIGVGGGAIDGGGLTGLVSVLAGIGGVLVCFSSIDGSGALAGAGL